MGYTNNGSITVSSRTIHLNPGESRKLEVRFNSMEECPLVYSLPINNSGTISEDGIYTAPDKPGSYEVRIASRDFSQIETYAYVQVGE